MKPLQSKNIISDCIKRGYVLIDGVYYPPESKEAERYRAETGKLSSKKRKSLKTLKIKSGFIDDYRNSKCLDRKDLFTRLIEVEFGLTVWPEFFFSTERQYRFDYCIPVDRDGKEIKVAIEVQGGIWMKGGAHSMPTHIERDMQKARLATSLGWKLIQCTPDELMTIKIIDLIKSML